MGVAGAYAAAMVMLLLLGGGLIFAALFVFLTPLFIRIVAASTPSLAGLAAVSFKRLIGSVFVRYLVGLPIFILVICLFGEQMTSYGKAWPLPLAWLVSVAIAYFPFLYVLGAAIAKHQKANASHNVLLAFVIVVAVELPFVLVGYSMLQPGSAIHRPAFCLVTYASLQRE